jgi:hypothetical protein
LYFHINGGAELYQELGFERLEVATYQTPTCDLSVETYYMEHPASALGVYLFQCDGVESPVDGVGDRNSGDYSEIMAIRGRWIIQCLNQTLDHSCLPMMIDLVNDRMSALPGADEMSPVAELPDEGRLAGTERVARGSLSLRLAAPDWPGGILESGGEAFMVLAEYDNGQDTARLAEIICASPEVAGQRFAAITAGGGDRWTTETSDGARARLTTPTGRVIFLAVDEYRLVLADSEELLHHGLRH